MKFSPRLILSLALLTGNALADNEPPPRVHYNPILQWVKHWSPVWFTDTDETPPANYWHGKYALGFDAFGIRAPLRKHGVDINGSYANNILANPVGGFAQGIAYCHNVGFGADLDLERLFGWEDAHFVISGLDRAGTNLSADYIGNQFTVAQLFGNQTIVFYGLYLDQTLWDGLFDFKIGRIATGDDFATSPIYWLHVNNGIDGNPQSVPVNGPFTAYPNATWGARLRFNPAETLQIQYGIYQATDRFGISAYHGLDFSIRPNDGVYMIAELEYKPHLVTHQMTADGGKTNPDPKSGKAALKPDIVKGLPGHYKFGVWSSNFNQNAFLGGQQWYNYGFYWHGDQQVTEEAPGSDQGLTIWSVLTLSPEQSISKLPFQVNGGLFYKGLIPTRDNDYSILAVIYGLFSDDFAESQAQLGKGVPSYEMVVECAYRIQLTPFAYVQPDLQWIINPGGTGNIPNALVLGGQMGVNF